MLTGREQEQNLMRQAYEMERSRFIAVYGRRRVGKTFLIRETFDYTFSFQHSGLAKGKYRDQLNAFAEALTDAGARDVTEPQNWMDAFSDLKDRGVREIAAYGIAFSGKNAEVKTARHE